MLNVTQPAVLGVSWYQGWTWSPPHCCLEDSKGGFFSSRDPAHAGCLMQPLGEDWRGLVHSTGERFSCQPGLETDSLGGCPFRWLCPTDSHVASSPGQ